MSIGWGTCARKCFWYAIKFKWHNNNWGYLSKEQYPAKLVVQEQSSNEVIIPRLNPSEARRMLGVHIAPDGISDAEATYLTLVTTEWGGKVVKARLNYAAADYCLGLVVYWKLMDPLSHNDIHGRTMCIDPGTYFSGGLTSNRHH